VNLLLDTHIWIWTLLDRQRLGAQVQSLLLDPAIELWLSPISVWELHLLLERGRIQVQGNSQPSTWIEMALATRPLREAALTRQVAIRSRAISTNHPDPADRFIAATASVYDLTLVTADRHLLAGSGYSTLANR
jgi:PIN domain nuclease of toxin-antitoxin system